MAKTLYSLFFLRRAFTVAAETTKVETRASMIRKAATESDKQVKVVGKEVFWMREPRTGNWIPETHFDEVDVAELRSKLLPNKKHN